MSLRLALRGLIILLVGALGLAVALFWFRPDTGGGPAATAPEQDTFVEPGEADIGGDYTLTAHTGEQVSQADFADSYQLVFFGFTHCPDVCPTTLSHISTTMELLGPDSEAVQPIFITVDPQRDTVDVLADYVGNFPADIVGLTGSPEAIADVAESFAAHYEKVSQAEYFDQETEGASGDLGDGYLMEHQSSVYLMSPEGHYLTHFGFNTDPETMAETIQQALVRFGRPAEGEA